MKVAVRERVDTVDDRVSALVVTGGDEALARRPRSASAATIPPSFDVWFSFAFHWRRWRDQASKAAGPTMRDTEVCLT